MKSPLKRVAELRPELPTLHRLNAGAVWRRFVSAAGKSMPPASSAGDNPHRTEAV